MPGAPASPEETKREETKLLDALATVSDKLALLTQERAAIEAELAYVLRLNKLREVVTEAQVGYRYLINLENLHPQNQLTGSYATGLDIKSLPDVALAVYQDLVKRFTFMPAHVIYNYTTDYVSKYDMYRGKYRFDQHRSHTCVVPADRMCVFNQEWAYVLSDREETLNDIAWSESDRGWQGTAETHVRKAYDVWVELRS